MATTTIDIEVPLHRAPSLAERFADWVTRSSKSVQLSRMIQALSELNDDQLAKVGLTRSGIPAHAYRIIYHGA